MVKPMCILVAEDSWADLFVLKQSLDQHLNGAYQLIECHDGDQVLLFINEIESGLEVKCPDLFVVDLHLPRWEGTEILKRIRSSPRLRDIPVAIVSGFDDAYGKRIATAFERCLYFRKSGSLTEFMNIGGALKQFAGENPQVSAT
jgi:CheY-like chemotaxis protein